MWWAHWRFQILNRGLGFLVEVDCYRVLNKPRRFLARPSARLVLVALVLSRLLVKRDQASGQDLSKLGVWLDFVHATNPCTPYPSNGLTPLDTH